MAVSRLNGFRVLTDYECGRAQLAIEWVSRGQKPIVEIGGCPTEGCDVVALARDLNRCIALSGESVRGFVMPDKIPGYCCYGFYRYPWAVEALRLLWGTKRPPTGQYHSLWLQGLVFGYSAAAIQRFISSASSVRASTTRSHACKLSCRCCRVEIYGPLARLVRRRAARVEQNRKEKK